MWSTVKSLSNKSKQTPHRMIIFQNNKITSIKKISKITNRFFIEKVINLRNIFTIPISNAMDFLATLVRRNSNEWKLKPIKIYQTLDIIKFSKSTNSVGRDCISMRVTKKIYKIIAPYLTHMINCICITSKYPNILKISCITLNYNQGKDPYHIPSYRPLDNISNIDKIVQQYLKQ